MSNDTEMVCECCGELSNEIELDHDDLKTVEIYDDHIGYVARNNKRIINLVIAQTNYTWQPMLMDAEFLCKNCQ